MGAASSPAGFRPASTAWPAHHGPVHGGRVGSLPMSPGHGHRRGSYRGGRGDTFRGAASFPRKLPAPPACLEARAHPVHRAPSKRPCIGEGDRGGDGSNVPRRWAVAQRGVVAAATLVMLRAYRAVVSPLLPPSCRFHPTCSAYAIESVERFGARKGLTLAVRRLLRCHPWGEGGYDPVPTSEE